MTSHIRYIVLGDFRQVERWRIEQRLPRQRVLDVCRHPQLLRGVAGPLQVVRLSSWDLVNWPTGVTVLDLIQILRDRGEITAPDRWED